MARPVVLTGFNDDDPAFYASGLIHDGFANLVVGSHGGGFDVEFFTGAQMKAWIGAINNKRGHEFNEEVAEEFRKLGFQARASVQMTEFNVPSEMGDLGDIDVLAWNGSDKAYIVECKKLRFAMTVGEIVDQLNRFRGEANDELAKHMKRFLWLGQHPDRLAKTIRCYGRLELVPLLVTNTIVPMQFSQDLPIPSESIMPTGALSQRLSRH